MSKGVRFILGAICHTILLIIGYCFLIVPGIYLSVILSFCLYGMITENYSLLDSFKYSIRLVKGKWWEVLGSILVPTIFIFPLLIFWSIVQGFIVVFAIIILHFDPNTIMSVSGILSTIALLVITPFLNVYSVKLYMQLQELTKTDSLGQEHI